MTVTVIIITAVIVVLAVLVLLLLGMRALSLGSREDDYDDEYEHDDVEDADRGDRRDRRGRDEVPEDEEDAPRGRSRRSRQDSGRAERRTKGRRQRGTDWEDDDSGGLSDNDFWSSLSDEDAGADRSGGHEYADRRDDGGYADDGVYADDYDDDDTGVPDHQNTIVYSPSNGTDTLPPAPAERGATGPSDLAMLASLGQGATPAPPEPAPRHQEQRPTAQTPAQGLAALPSAQGLPPAQGPGPTQGLPAASAPAPLDDDPLGPGSWTPHPPSTGDPFAGREPLRPVERNESTAPDPLGDAFGGGSPGGGSLGGPAGSDPLGGGGLGGGSLGGGLGEGRSSYDSGSMSRSDYPPLGSGSGGGVGTGPGSPDPLDPGFRPSPSSGDDLSSPIWSSMDTGAHQRPPSPLGGYGAGPAHGGGTGGAHGAPGSGAQPAPGQPMGGPTVPGHRFTGADDPLTGGYTPGSFASGSSYDSGSFSRSE
ncbi:hypothetical protein ABZ635_09665, partial [Nocardiopsis sp. NPDC007018]|uniref:hypothetical protein n=1 Tax=Nocardiopsis sp. NPDC007018 TaxID=3155721 RepID=UPI003408AC91